MVVILEGSPISTEELWSAVRVTIGFMVTSLTKALLPRLLSLGGFKLLPFKNNGGHCVLGDLHAEEMFWYPSPDLCLDTILSLLTIASTSWLGFYSDMHCQLWDLI